MGMAKSFESNSPPLPWDGPVRLTYCKFFLGSTTELVERQVNDWCSEEKLCPGNLLDSKLYKHGGVYQFVVWHADVVEKR